MKVIPWLSTAAISFSHLAIVQADTLWVDNVLDQAGMCRCGMLDPFATFAMPSRLLIPHDTITFRQTLSGETIALTAGELTIDKRLTLDGDVDNDSLPDITLDTDNENRIISTLLPKVCYKKQENEDYASCQPSKKHQGTFIPLRGVLN